MGILSGFVVMGGIAGFAIVERSAACRRRSMPPTWTEALPPFNAGYHEWAPHYDVGDVQRKIRKPSQLVDGSDAHIFIVGEAYSSDQAWEGAYCTAESVLNGVFGIEPIIDDRNCPPGT